MLEKNKKKKIKNARNLKFFQKSGFENGESTQKARDFSGNISNNLSQKMPNKIKNLKKGGKGRLFLKIIGGLFGAGFLIVAGVFIYYAKDLPDPGKINKRIVAESTKIYDRTGEHLLYDIHGEEKRTVIPVDQIPDAVKFATIVLEDQSFFSHHGVDFQGIMRAALKDVINMKVQQGGSTITQQFVKNSILTSEKRLSRKIKEVVLAIEIEQKFEKDQILQMYLNEIPYGSNAYGIEAAAQTFFGKNARDLNLAQSALLACLPNAPTYYSPHGSHVDRLLTRWKYSLSQMKNLGYITEEQYNEAVNQDIISQVKPYGQNINAPHFVMYVKEKLVEEFGEEEMQEGGFKVYTTLDWDMQQIAEKAVREGVEENGEKYNFSNAALVAINPKNGQIMAMVGSKDYFNEEIDGNVNVATRLRQPGSSFKPYVYAQAFREGYTPDTIIFDVDTDFETEDGEEYNPKNYDNKNRGPLKMKEALSMSLNVPAVKVLYLAGVKDSIKLAKKMGISSLNDPERYGLSLVLGGGEVMLLDHVGAFGVFANDGMRQEKTAIMKIEDAGGNVLREFKQEKGEEVLEKEVARQMCAIMSDNSLRAPVFGTNNNLVIPDRQVIAKTGTTNEWRDGWLIGAAPSLAAGVWAGNNDNSPMAEGADGSYVAGPIWNNFMKNALANMQKEEFPKVEDIEKEEGEKDKDEVNKPILTGKLEMREEVEVCKNKDGDYCLASDACPDSLKEKKKFFTAHTILYYVDKDDPRGDAPENPEDDPQYKEWEKAVQKWAKKEYDNKYDEMPEDKCSEDDFSGHFAEISIASPNNNAIISGQDITIKTNISGDADVQQVDFFFGGKAIGTRKSKPYELAYKIPADKNGQTVDIEVKVYDEDGGRDSDKINVKVEF